jgi:hypothetical protein
MRSLFSLLTAVSLLVLSSAIDVVDVVDVVKDTLTGYDWSAGNTSVWLSAAAYCETSTYKSRVFKGPSTGFVVTNVIDYKAEDVQVGYLVSDLLFEFRIFTFILFGCFVLVTLFFLSSFALSRILLIFSLLLLFMFLFPFSLLPPLCFFFLSSSSVRVTLDIFHLNPPFMLFIVDLLLLVIGRIT